MNIVVSVKLDRLLRDLRLAGHVAAETAERESLRVLRRKPAEQRQPERAGTREQGGKRP